MAAGTVDLKWPRASPSITFAVAVAGAAISIAAAFISITLSANRRRSKRMQSLVRELEASLATALDKGVAERRGRVRAQQALREALAEQRGSNSGSPCSTCYPMVPIGTIHSCFSTRNGTPRQSLLIPMARACLTFDRTRVPTQALEGLSDFSHCWIIYVFHLNTDIEKLWKHPGRSKVKAKVRVPRLKGDRIGVLATRSPHRPCPIGITVGKIEARDDDGRAILFSGVDLVDGTPILDIKPYLPYSDSVQDATIPNWLKDDNALAVASVNFSKDFLSSLSSCWLLIEKHSLYSCVSELQLLIKEVLSWDIRSVSQKKSPHNVVTQVDENQTSRKDSSSSHGGVTYHLILEGIDISYKIDGESNIEVGKVYLWNEKSFKREWRYYSVWKKMLTR